MTFHLDELDFTSEMFSTVKKNLEIFSEFILFCNKNNINYFPYLYIPIPNGFISKINSEIQFTESNEPPSLYLIKNEQLELQGKEINRKIFFDDNNILIEKITRFIKEINEQEYCLLISKK